MVRMFQKPPITGNSEMDAFLQNIFEFITFQNRLSNKIDLNNLNEKNFTSLDDKNLLSMDEKSFYSLSDREEVTMINDEQTLTNKTLTSPDINGGTVDDATLTGNVISGGNMQDGTVIYGSWAAAVVGTPTQAAKDSLLVTKVNAGRYQVFTDSANPPTTLRAEVEDSTANSNYGSSCVPVKKTDYYLVTSIGGNAPTGYLIPLAA